jgi:hypothetical protein
MKKYFVIPCFLILLCGMVSIPSAKAQNVFMEVIVDDQGSYAYQGTYVISWVLTRLPSTIVSTSPSYNIVSASGTQPFQCYFYANVVPDVMWRVDVTVRHYYGGNLIDTGYKSTNPMDSDALLDTNPWDITVPLP